MKVTMEDVSKWEKLAGKVSNFYYNMNKKYLGKEDIEDMKQICKQAIIYSLTNWDKKQKCKLSTRIWSNVSSYLQKFIAFKSYRRDYRGWINKRSVVFNVDKEHEYFFNNLPANDNMLEIMMREEEIKIICSHLTKREIDSIIISQKSFMKKYNVVLKNADGVRWRTRHKIAKYKVAWLDKYYI